MPKTLLQVLQEQNIEIFESSSGRFVAHCPFHQGDESPSFTVYPNDTYFCFGCEAWGDAVKFMCDFKGLSSKEAQEYVGVDYEYKKADKAQVIKTTNTTETWAFLNRVSTLYHAHLLRTDGAYNYLLSRGLSATTISQYKLGYTDGRVLNFGFASDIKLGVEAGILNKSGWETLSHRITIPNRLDSKQVDFIIGRTVVNDKIKYLGARMPKPIYGFHEVSKEPLIFVSEGQFDWLILRQWGIPAIVLSGTHLPKYQRMLLDNKTLIIVTDNDESGKKAARSLHASVPNSYIVDWGESAVNDIGDLGKMSDGKKLFTQLIREQEWYKQSLRALEESTPMWKIQFNPYFTSSLTTTLSHLT